jgi:hypothetical protein
MGAPGLAEVARPGNSWLLNAMDLRRRRARLVLVLGALTIGALCLLYLKRTNRCVLYYYGTEPDEVPQGTAIAVLNPLRNRKDERNAEWLIRDLRTAKCEEVSRELLADPTQICSTMRGNTKATLIWLDRERDTIRGGTRRLIYNLPDKKARLVIYFGADEPGWMVKTVSVTRRRTRPMSRKIGRTPHFISLHESLRSH